LPRGRKGVEIVCIGKDMEGVTEFGKLRIKRAKIDGFTKKR
jgi:hypothetical protein